MLHMHLSSEGFPHAGASPRYRHPAKVAVSHSEEQKAATSSTAPSRDSAPSGSVWASDLTVSKLQTTLNPKP